MSEETEKSRRMLQGISFIPDDSQKQFLTNCQNYAVLDAEGKKKYAVDNPHLAPKELERMERIGKREIHPNIVFSDSLSRPFAEKLSFDEQLKALSQDIEVLSGDGRVYKMSFEKMGLIQAFVVFGDHIRTIKEQYDFAIEKHITLPVCNDQEEQSEPEKPYSISNGKVFFSQFTEVTKDDLIKIIEEMGRGEAETKAIAS